LTFICIALQASWLQHLQIIKMGKPKPVSLSYSDSSMFFALGPAIDLNNQGMTLMKAGTRLMFAAAAAASAAMLLLLQNCNPSANMPSQLGET
jgi:hypothetical protein